MEVKFIADKLNLKLIAGDASGEFDVVYTGDLLSRAMSRVKKGSLWITIMSNVNVIAVASLACAAAVVLAEGVTLDEAAIQAAEDNGITVYSSNRSAYELCRDISQYL